MKYKVAKTRQILVKIVDKEKIKQVFKNMINNASDSQSGLNMRMV